jgi:hypothetical protein
MENNNPKQLFLAAKQVSNTKEKLQSQQRVDKCVSLFVDLFKQYGDEWKRVLQTSSKPCIYVTERMRLFSSPEHNGFIGLEKFYKLLVCDNFSKLNKDEEVSQCRNEIRDLFGLSFGWEIISPYGQQHDHQYDYVLFKMYPEKGTNDNNRIICDLGKIILDRKNEVEQQNKLKIQAWKEKNHEKIENETKKAMGLFSDAFNKYGKIWEKNILSQPKPWKCVNSRFWNTESKEFPGLGLFYNYLEGLHGIIQGEIVAQIEKDYGMTLVSYRFATFGGGELYFE